MPSQKNIDQLKDLTEKLSRSKTVILADYTGLSVSQQDELRQKIRDAGGQFVVAKNRLFRLALQESSKGLPRLERGEALRSGLEEALRGPTAFLLAFEDEIGSIKALVQFAEKNNLPNLKIGIVLQPENRILTIEEIENLAKLPTRDEIIARLVGTLNAPRFRLVYVLSGNMQKLILTIKAIKEKKETN